MMECLLAPPEVAPFVVIKGDAGSGKTYADCIRKALSNIDSYSDDKLNIGHYREFLVSAPVVEMTKEQKWDIFQEMSKKNSVLYTGGF